MDPVQFLTMIFESTLEIASTPQDFNELATHVTAIEQNANRDDVTAKQADQVRTSLVHSDLPMLEDTALVEFDRRSEAVRYSQPPDLLETLLRLCVTFDAPVVQSH